MDINDILTLQELADYLKIAPKTVSRMIQRGEIPCMKIAGQWRFRKTVIDDWLNSKMTFSEEHNLASLMEVDSQVIQLSRLVPQEFMIMDLHAGDADEVLLELTSPLDRLGLSELKPSLISRLKAREQMVTTAVGFGTAFPHIRNVRDNNPELPPIIMGISRKGLDYGCLDGSKTHLFFLLLAHTEVSHLKLLARLAAFARKQGTLERVLRAQRPNDISQILMEDDYESMAQPAQ